MTADAPAVPADLRQYLEASGYRRHPSRAADAWERAEGATLRVIAWKTATHVHAFDGQMQHAWSAKFTAGTPGAAIAAFLREAEREGGDG